LTGLVILAHDVTTGKPVSKTCERARRKRTLLSFQRPCRHRQQKASDSRQRPPFDSVQVVSDSVEGAPQSR
jgi:hypothetical protein